MKKLKILELTNYSAGTCGVWQRVKQESKALSKKYEVRVFSSNFVKGLDKIAPQKERMRKVKIIRFPAKKLGGESFMKWDFEKAAIDYNPDVIITHSYRHMHTTKAIEIAKKINAKVFLVTHAPFARSSTRSFIQKVIVKAYDTFIGKRTLNSFDKILAITKWEIPYLLRLGVKKQNIMYIPNGIPKEFFNQKKFKEQNKILFLGRVSPIKYLETLVLAMKFVKGNIKLEIVGPAEKEYLSKLKRLIKSKKLGSKIRFSKPVFDVKKKIKKIDSCKIFVLPSKSEGMPQSLVEAMARGKMVIASNNPGTRDLIEDEKNGYLFEIGDSLGLARTINGILESKSNEKIQKQAKKFTKKFSLKNTTSKLEELF